MICSTALFVCLYQKAKSSLWLRKSKLVSTGGPHYMRSFYLRIHVYAIDKWLFSGTYPLIYSDCRSFYMRIHYMRVPISRI